jgi:hypothetical protein
MCSARADVCYGPIADMGLCDPSGTMSWV